MADNITRVNIDGEIQLDQFLKWCRAVSTGGHGKFMIQNNMVKVNGALENRRGRKLKDGDLVQVEKVGSFRVVTR